MPGDLIEKGWEQVLPTLELQFCLVGARYRPLISKVEISRGNKPEKKQKAANHSRMF